MESWLERLPELPENLLLLLMALAAALENVVPPLPADLLILFGGFLVGQGGARLWLVALLVWLSNVAGALLVYGLGRRYGTEFFSGRWGQRVLRPKQLASLGDFYRRFGFPVIFVSRFLPIFRAVVPAFAGVSHLGFWRTAVPLALASAIWYPALVFVGALAGQNWRMIWSTVQLAGRWFAGAALLLAAFLLWWWWRTRTRETSP